MITHLQLWHSLIENNYQCSGTVCLDERQEPCYLEHSRGICSSSVHGLFSRQLCCCSLGRGWGDKCSRCPRPGKYLLLIGWHITTLISDWFTHTNSHLWLSGSQEHHSLCSGSRGLDDVNECAVFPGICKNGECRNTPGSFECICNRGYALDETAFQALGSDILYDIFFIITRETFMTSSYIDI